MADEFQLGNGNWWDASRNSGTTSPANRGWPIDIKLRPDSERITASGAALHGGVLANPDLQIMGLGLSSQAMDWNVQSLLSGEKGEGCSFRSILEEDTSSNTSNYQQDSQINREFSIDQSHFTRSSSNDVTITSPLSFPVDSAAAYGLLTPEKHHHEMSYPYPSSGYDAVNYAELVQSWNKFPQLSRQSPPPPPLAFGSSSSSHLHFANSSPPFWTAMNDARSSFPPSPRDEKPKNNTTAKKNSTEASNKRGRSETQSQLPAFKVRKEKMGDRITALQQLVSPFGKTDTASVLSEAIVCIKFLHEQVGALCTPYIKTGGAHIQHQQNSEKSKDPEEGRQDLRSRGLCLVPVSSTFPITSETTIDFWTPTFGGSFR